jgi:AcrR family transcriptional regulator
MLPHDEDDRVDGRKLRGVKTRRAIVLALLELIEEGNAYPPAREIADRAKIAIRSIRQHFETREELLLAVAAEHAERMAVARETIETDAPLEERIDRFTQARAKELEASITMRQAAMLNDESDTVDRAIRATAKARRRDVARVFETEIARVPAQERKALLDALEAATAGRTWDAMRRDAGLGSSAARDAMRLLVAGLVSRYGK